MSTHVAPSALRIAVAIATTGRAQILARTLPLILDQARRADRVIVVAAQPSDVPDPSTMPSQVEVMFARRGSCTQRNAALTAVADDCDVIVYFDDDFVPSRQFLASLEALFIHHAEVVAVTGLVVLDGINHGGCSIEEAQAAIQHAEAEHAQRPLDYGDVDHLYGCNMAARVTAALEVGFDERLPLYAWQEDRDFSRRLKAYGRVIRSGALIGSHLGVTLGRSPGLRVGYSQVANPLYLMQKGTMGRMETALLIGRNVTANLVKTLRPEPWIDRPGRARGNLKALMDACLGRSAPERILQL